MAEDIEEQSSNILPRIFINGVDTYLSSNLAQHLASCNAGQALDEEEELDIEEEDRLVEPEPSKKPELSGYRVVGTISHPTAQKPDFVQKLLNYENRRDFYEDIFECDYIIYDITKDASQVDEALWVAKSLADDYGRIEKKKTFILISHLLSWLYSKSDNVKGNHLVHDEENHAKRKPHPHYQRQYDVEKTILQLGKKHRHQFVSYIVGCGIPYGGHEDILEQFFLKAWMNIRELDVYGDGENIIPTIHIKDLAVIVQAIIENPPHSRYIVAKDRSEASLGEIITAISKVLGTGEIRRLRDNELIGITEIPKVYMDQLMMDLVINTPTLDDELPIPWRCETGILDNIENLAQEYVKAKEFKPLRICILGPPFVGKTTHAIALARHYGLHYIHVTPVLFEAYIRLRTVIKALEQVNLEEEQDKRIQHRTMQEEKMRQPPHQLLPTATSLDIPDEQLSWATYPPNDEAFSMDITEPTPVHSIVPDIPIIEASEIAQEEQTPSESSLMESLPEEVQRRYPSYPPVKWTDKFELEMMAKSAEEELNEFMDGMRDEFHAEDHIVNKYLRQKLLSKPCLNQGFVLDGYPTTFEQAEALFADPTEGTRDPRYPRCDAQIIPHHVIYLEGSNALISHRYKKMLEEEGVIVDEIEDFVDPDGTTLNVEEEVYLRRAQADNARKAGKETGKGERRKSTDLRIKWVRPFESPEKRLRRRLEKHRSAMAPKKAVTIFEQAFEPYSHLVAEKEAPSKLYPPPWPRKPLANAELDPLEKNVLTYFDLREINPFIVDMDRDKSRYLYPGGPQKYTFKKLLKRISKSPTGDFVRRTRSLLDTRDDDQKFVEDLQLEATKSENFNDDLRREAADVLNENEKMIWHNWMMLLKRENEQRHMVKSMPRRNYLLKYVLPKIAECLVVYGQRRPTDPVDFLAEYLLRDAGVNFNGIVR